MHTLVPSYVPVDASVSSSRCRERPKHRPLHLKQSFFTIFRRGGLRFVRWGLQTACEAGELHYRRVRHAGDTPSEGLV